MYIKHILLIPFLLVAQTLSAQTFSEGASNFFEDVQKGSIAFADVDGDNDQDLLLTGEASLGGVTKLYINDGQGNFSEVPGTPFPGVFRSSVAFADVDGDNDQDLLLTGTSDASIVSKLYINDGQGNFSEATGAPFEGVNYSSVAFADVDGDNDQDVLLTGNNISGALISKLYTNDGQGNFTEVTGAPFNGVYQSSIAFADVDGDNDQDVLITGTGDTTLTEPISTLYTNDGQGNFSEVAGTPFAAVEMGSIAFADVNGDNDKDVLITGSTSSNGYTSSLYTNNGQGNFSEVTGTSFASVARSSIAFADVDGDNDQDVLLTGTDGDSFEPRSTLYKNDGQGNFSQVAATPFDDVSKSSVAFADVDGDNDKDVFLTGRDSSFGDVSKLYTNNGQGNFNDITSTPFGKVAADSSSKGIYVRPYPNPTKGKHLQVKYNAPEKGDVQIKVYGINGHLVKKQNKFAKRGQQSFSLKLSSLAQGNYLLELQQARQKGYARFTVH